MEALRIEKLMEELWQPQDSDGIFRLASRRGSMWESSDRTGPGRPRSSISSAENCRQLRRILLEDGPPAPHRRFSSPALFKSRVFSTDYPFSKCTDRVAGEEPVSLQMLRPPRSTRRRQTPWSYYLSRLGEKTDSRRTRFRTGKGGGWRSPSAASNPAVDPRTNPAPVDGRR